MKNWVDTKEKLKMKKSTNAQGVEKNIKRNHLVVSIVDVQLLKFKKRLDGKEIKKMKQVAIYCRVSTDGQTLEQQITACKKYCEFKNLFVKDVIEEKGSGKDLLKRPKFQELWNKLRKHEFDGVVVFRIDRLGRNVRDMVLFFDEMVNKGLEIHSVNESLDMSTPIGKAIVNIIIVMAQLEREQISLATRQRLQALKNQGKKLGRPKGSPDKNKRSSKGYEDRWRRERLNKRGRISSHFSTEGTNQK